MIVLLIGFIIINGYVYARGSRFIRLPQNLSPTQTILVLGAAVYPGGRLSDIYRDRVQTALELYEAKKASRILVSGDNSTINYDEVTPAKKYLTDHGVPTSSIVLDYAGFDTYDSLYRAKAIFGVTSTIVVTQRFHLPRALYIGQALGLEIQGIVADRQTYRTITYLYLRENGARLKAWFNLIFHTKPKFLGEKITWPVLP